MPNYFWTLIFSVFLGNPSVLKSEYTWRHCHFHMAPGALLHAIHFCHAKVHRKFRAFLWCADVWCVLMSAQFQLMPSRFTHAFMGLASASLCHCRGSSCCPGQGEGHAAISRPRHLEIEVAWPIGCVWCSNSKL